MYVLMCFHFYFLFCEVPKTIVFDYSNEFFIRFFFFLEKLQVIYLSYVVFLADANI